jgi:site-specific recombinase XerD
MPNPPTAALVLRKTKGNRLRTITSYLKWLGQRSGESLGLAEASGRMQRLDAMLKTLGTLAPPTKGRNVVGEREAPPLVVLDHLLAVIDPTSPDNPWRDVVLRLRNRLLVHFLYALGLRRGEALGIKIQDHIQWRQGTILIARNANDPSDPHKRQPLAKTRDRLLPVKNGLMDMMHAYVVHIRRKIPGAKGHQFLFVSHQTGRPLTEVAVNKVFRSLRDRTSGLPDDLTPHLLRHGWGTTPSAA